MSAVMYASRNGHLNIVEALLQAGANIHDKSKVMSKLYCALCNFSKGIHITHHLLEIVYYEIHNRLLMVILIIIK
jgi:ankyrin repeat protein